MNLLAFDTATAACSVALVREDGTVFDGSPPAARMFEQPAHATELLPALVAVLERAKLNWNEIGALAVGIGPGAFTGLRIGVATARAIGTARGLSLAPVSSLAALAHAAGGPAHSALPAEPAPGAETARPVIPLIDAKRGEIFHRFPGAADGVAEPGELIGRVAELVAAGPPPLAVGDGAVKLRAELAAAGAEVPGDDDPRHLVSAIAIARLAAAARPLPPEQVVPNYIRPPDAKVSARERWLAAPGS